MEYDDDGKPVVWKSVDHTMKLVESLKGLTTIMFSPHVGSDTKQQLARSIDSLSFFLQNEAKGLERAAKQQIKDAAKRRELRRAKREKARERDALHAASGKAVLDWDDED